jgi:hypothetical protein
MALVFARIRLPLQYLGTAILGVGVVALIASLLGAPFGSWPGLAVGIGVALFVVAWTLTVMSPSSRVPPVEVEAPVRGRWQAINSPTGKLPSHGTHAYGQTFAVDLVHLPEGVEHPEFGRAERAFLPPTAFPAFGRALYAPVDAVVVRSADGARDHLSRSSWLAYGYLIVESMFRELRGPAGVLGNHLVLRMSDGTHFVLAHLRRCSIRVGPGDVVSAGQVVAECGNSGNSTEPHLHCQRQDVASTLVALGLPWTIRGPGIPREGGIVEF